MRTLLSLLCLAICGGPAAFAADLTHRPRLVEGQELRTQIENKTKQTLTIAGMPIDTEVEQFVVSVDKVLSLKSDGASELSSRMESMQMSLSHPGGKFSFDSGNPDAGSDPQLQFLSDFLRQLSKAESTSKYGADGRARELTWKDGAFAQPNEMFKNEVDPQTMVTSMNQEIDRLPGKSVEPGAVWTRTEVFPMGGGQTLTTDMEYKYVGPATVNGQSLEQITFRAVAVRLTVEPNPASPLEVKSSDLKVQESVGTMHYSPQAGRVIMTQHKLHVVGDLEVSVQGNELPGAVDFTIETKNTLES